MAFQCPSCNIVQQDYHSIVNYKIDEPTNPPAYPPTHPLAYPLVHPLIDLLFTLSLEALDNAVTTESIHNRIAARIKISLLVHG